MAIFTHTEWRRSLLSLGETRSEIIQCSWIDEHNILAKPIAVDLWQKKLASTNLYLKVILAGRLEECKGVRVLLKVMKILNEQNVPVKLSILSGLRECFQADVTGMFYPVNDALAIVEAFKWAFNNLAQLKDMSMTSLHVAHDLTHQEMHRKRWQLLQAMLSRQSLYKLGECLQFV